MSTPMHTADGLYNRDVCIEDGKIKLVAMQGVVTIGSVDKLLSLPPYQNEVYETKNGIQIDLREFISHLSFPPKYAKSLKRADPTVESDDNLSDRLIQFNKHLVDQLEGDVTW